MSIFSTQYCHKCALGEHPDAPAIDVKNLYAAYPDRHKNVLHDISLIIKKGSRAALLGPNGSGKSTLMKTLVGFLQPSSGSVCILGHDLSDCQHLLTYLPQRSEIDWNFPISLYNLVLTGAYIHTGWFKRPSKIHHEKTLEALKTVQLTDLTNRQINQLSVGQQQRALIARALVHNAEIYLLDEPFNAVDQKTQAIMYETFKEISSSGKTILLSTHDNIDLSNNFNETIYLEDGRMIKTESFHNA